MADVSILFRGASGTNSNEKHLEVFTNHYNGITLSITDPDDPYMGGCHICFTKETAIKLHRELKKQISFIKDAPF